MATGKVPPSKAPTHEEVREAVVSLQRLLPELERMKEDIGRARAVLQRLPSRVALVMEDSVIVVHPQDQGGHNNIVSYPILGSDSLGSELPFI